MTDVEETKIAFKCLAEEMEVRYSALEAYGAADIEKYNELSQSKMKRIVIVIDELIDLISYSNTIFKIINGILAKGKKVGIHMIFSISQPHPLIQSLIIGVSAAVVFNTKNVNESCNILDIIQAEHLSDCGDVFYDSGKYSCKRAQIPYIEAEESLKLIKT